MDFLPVFGETIFGHPHVTFDPKVLLRMNLISIHPLVSMNKTPTQGPRQVYGNEGSVHSYSLEERRSFAEYINQLLKDDPDLRDVLPLNPNSDDLFNVCSQGLLLMYVI